MKKTVMLVVLVALLYAAWDLFFPHRFRTTAPLSLQDGRRVAFIPLPDGATDIHIATYRRWIAYLNYFRFHAPPETCVNYVNVLVRDISAHARMPITSVSTNRIAPDSRVKRRPDLHICPFADGLPWFDVDRITNGMIVQLSGGLPHPTIYVDTDRGVFFYLETD